MIKNRCQWFFCGLIAGAVAGLLSSPRSGARTRARIASKAKRAVTDFRDAVTGTFDRAKDAVEDAQERLAGAVKATRKTFTA
jgi:gas vesicle protein